MKKNNKQPQNQINQLIQEQEQKKEKFKNKKKKLHKPKLMHYLKLLKKKQRNKNLIEKDNNQKEFQLNHIH